MTHTISECEAAFDDGRRGGSAPDEQSILYAYWLTGRENPYARFVAPEELPDSDPLDDDDDNYEDDYEDEPDDDW